LQNAELKVQVCDATEAQYLFNSWVRKNY